MYVVENLLDNFKYEYYFHFANSNTFSNSDFHKLFLVMR